MKFNIPKQARPVKERIDVKLERSVLQTLDAYCQYMESDRDYVIGTVLAVIFKKDKGFAQWRRSQGASAEANASARSLPREVRA